MRDEMDALFSLPFLLSIIALVAAVITYFKFRIADEEEERLNTKARGLASLTSTVENTVSRRQKD